MGRDRGGIGRGGGSGVGRGNGGREIRMVVKDVEPVLTFTVNSTRSFVYFRIYIPLRQFFSIAF